METIYFVIILIMILVFFKLNIWYKKTHNDKPILNESKVKKTLTNVALIDDLFRIISDASLLVA